MSCQSTLLWHLTRSIRKTIKLRNTYHIRPNCYCIRYHSTLLNKLAGLNCPVNVLYPAIRHLKLAPPPPNFNKAKLVEIILDNKYILGTICGVVFILIERAIGLIGLVMVAVPLGFYYRRKIAVMYSTFPRDFNVLKRYIMAAVECNELERKGYTIHDCFEQTAVRNPHKIMISSDDAIWTYKEMNHYVNKIVRYFHRKGFDKSDVVGIFVTNRPEYIGLILAFTKLAMISALINTQLKKQMLINRISMVRCRAVIVSEDLMPIINEIKPFLATNKIEIFQLDGKPKEKDVVDLQAELSKVSSTYMKLPYIARTFDPIIYAFSVGPNGLPQAAIIPSNKFMFHGLATIRMLSMTEKEKIYNVLPFYNITNLMTGVGPTIMHLIPVTIKRHFIPKDYFADCKKHSCTVGQYGGEICRYLLAEPPNPNDKTHGIRIVYGSGMHPNIAHKFWDRFNLRSREFYGASEGPATLVNLEKYDGAAGYKLNCLPQGVRTNEVIRVRKNTLLPVRNVSGLCIVCEDNEPGMLVGFISTRPGARFNGYMHNSLLTADTRSPRVIHNVLKHGDSAFASGDIFMRDKLGYFYYLGRSGVNFIWRASHISVEEVENIILSATGIQQCMLYGVKVPNSMERAPMLVLANKDGKIKCKKFCKEIKEHLPSYSLPIFIRILKTNRIVYSREVYIQEGYDPNFIEDQLFYYNKKKEAYDLLTPELYKDIVADNILI